MLLFLFSKSSSLLLTNKRSILFQGYLLWTNPTWLLPWMTDGFECITNWDNWVKPEQDGPATYEWQTNLINEENRSTDARKSLGHNV